MDGKEFLESKQVKNIVLGISNQIGVVDLATLLDLYRTEQLKLHIVSNSLTSKEAIDYEIYAKRKDKEENLKGWVFALFFGTAFVIGIIALISWIGS